MTPDRRCGGRGVCALIALLWMAAAPLAGQTASPWLPRDHWSALALGRLYAAGGGVHDPAADARTVAAAEEELGGALAGRLGAEGWGRLRVEGAALLTGREGAARAGGFTLDREWTGIMPLPDRAAAGGRLAAAAVPVPWLALTAVADATSDAARLQHGTAEIGVGAVGIWGGRRHVGYSPGEGGGLVVARLPRFDGAGVRLARPIAVPLLGTLSGEVLAGPADRNGHVEAPWLLVARAHARPHSRVDVGVTRAALFGGLSGARLGPVQVAEVLVGANLGGDYADDQVASADVRWRPPLATPAELYLEWGMHDIDLGVLVDMPTYTVGVRLPRFPAEHVGVALEHTRMSGSCCENPPWYHHFELADGWRADGAFLGHPLGGHGEEWRVGLSGHSPAASLVFDAGAALRWRGGENVYAPERAGRSGRLELAADVALAAKASAAIELAAERGRGWTELAGRVVARLRF